MTIFNVGIDIDVAHEPTSWSEFIGNISLIGFWDSTLTISQAWSLRIELVFYAVMIFLCRDYRIVGIWLFVSIAYVIYQSQQNLIFL